MYRRAAAVGFRAFRAGAVNSGIHSDSEALTIFKNPFGVQKSAPEGGRTFAKPAKNRHPALIFALRFRVAGIFKTASYVGAGPRACPFWHPHGFYENTMLPA